MDIIYRPLISFCRTFWTQHSANVQYNKDGIHQRRYISHYRLVQKSTHQSDERPRKRILAFQLFFPLPNKILPLLPVTARQPSTKILHTCHLKASKIRSDGRSRQSELSDFSLIYSWSLLLKSSRSERLLWLPPPTFSLAVCAWTQLE